MKSALRRPSRTWRRTAAAAVGGDHEDPVAAGVVVEGAVRHQPRLRGGAERHAQLHGLAALQLARLLADELQVDLERAVADLRIDLG